MSGFRIRIRPLDVRIWVYAAPSPLLLRMQLKVGQGFEVKASYDVLESPAFEEREAILALLRAHNLTCAQPPADVPLTIALRDADGTTIGGIAAVSAYDWLIVEFLFVPQEMRGEGVGAKLLTRAEAIARTRGCRGAWLTTFSFQARGFYEKLGYQLFGTVEDHPAGDARYFLKKALG